MAKLKRVWHLSFEGIEEHEVTDDERRYIADLIVNGYISGELIRDGEEIPKDCDRVLPV